MPITSIEKDPAALTMTVAAESSASVDRLWDAYADPGQIERFWGPPMWPATLLRHDVRTGGRSAYANPETVNELTFTPVGGRTLLSLVITYPSADVRDAVLATGMVGGMETNYQRLESQLAA
jgi:hypothetical protein